MKVSRKTPEYHATTSIKLILITFHYILPLFPLQIAQSALRREHVLCLCGPRYSGRAHLAELLARNLLRELLPGDTSPCNVVLYERGELAGEEEVHRLGELDTNIGLSGGTLECKHIF